MDELIRLLPAFLPAAIAWAETQAQVALSTGTALSQEAIADARAVGVAHPEEVRLAVVPTLPFPDDPELRVVAVSTGLLAPGTVGLTLGHAILVVRGHLTRRLLTHELRHVHQYERAGSIAAFVSTYLRDIATFGYWDTPFEVDARHHEIV